MFTSWFHQALRQPARRSNGVTRRRSYRPIVDALEDRNLLSFYTPTAFPVGTTPVAQVVGDFNGDGKPDLVVVNQGANTVSVLPGKGDGTFGLRTDYAVGTTPVGVVVGDFNGDSKLDIAVANFGAKTVSVLLGNGDGTFQPKADIALGTAPVSLAVGDLNGDGNPDLMVATEDLSNDYVNVLLGTGSGTFLAPVSIVSDTAFKFNAITLEAFSTISTADFNGDGHLDLVVVNNKDAIIPRNGFVQETGTVSVLLGNGNGTLQSPTIFTVDTSPRTVAVGDFNGDGRPDIAVGNYGRGVLSVLMNTGGGNFAAPVTSGLAGAPLSLAAADFNGDGRAELAIDLVNQGTVEILSVQANGTLQPTATYVPGAGFLATGDLNDDAHPDLITAAYQDAIQIYAPPANTVSTLLNNGNGTFPGPAAIANPGAVLASQASADFNGDGIPDLALGSGKVELGLGDGHFGDPTTVLSDGGGVAALDIDGNGTQDLLVGGIGLQSGVILLTNSPGWDNRTGGAVGFTVSVAPQVTAGANVGVIVTAVDAAGNPVPGFLGTVDLDDTAPGATSPGLLQQYTLSAADAGRHTFVVTGLTKAGLNTLSTYAVAMPTVSTSVTVVPAALAKFVFATPASVTAGTSFAYTITAEDTFGNVETGYTGTVHFAASTADTQAVLPADYTFTAADAGAHTFSATLFRTQSAISPTTPSLTATAATAHVSSSTAMNVLALAPNSLAMFNVPSGATAGIAAQIIVAALDVYGNAASGYAGTVHFSSSDAQASLPADYTFTAADHGAHYFFVTLKSAGTQSLSVADTANPAFASSAPSITVVPGAPTTWIVSGLATTSTAGAPMTFTLTAKDAYGNLATNYTGTVHFSSSDAQAALPANYTFTAADAGTHTFSATLKTAGTQTLTVADSLFTALTTTESITVSPAAAASVQLTGFPTATIAGVAQPFTVTLRDAFGNVASGYTGTVAFTSSDPIAALPANYTFTAADAGVHTFTAALKRAGTQSITVADTTAPALTSTEGGIVVSPAAVSQFAISGPTSVTQGVGFKITVSAEDAYGNVNAGYRGAVHLSSTDSTGGTQNFTFSNNDNGVHIFSYTFNALGFQTITVVDTTNSSIIGTITLDVLPK